MILKNENATVRFGLFVIFIFVVVFGLWIGLAPLNSAAVAVGKVSVVDNKKIIQHLEGGVVEKIFVKDGDVVKANDPLLEIKNTKLDSSLEIVKNEFLQTSVLVSRLIAQRDNALSISFDRLIEDIHDSQKAKQSQISIFNEQKQLLKDEKEILHQRITQLKSQIDSTQAIVNAKQSRILSLNEEAAEWERLFKEQLTDKIRLRDLKREKVLLEGEIASGKADMARLNVQITETQSQITLRDRTFKENVLTQLEAAKLKLIDSQQKYIALKDEAERTIIRTPVDGTVVELAFHTLGGVVRSSEKIMSIVPSDADYIIDAKLQITDIDAVYVGLPADLRFSAFNSSQSKVIEGRITYVSADSLKDEHGNQYYELKAEILPEGVKELEKNDFFLLPGMPVEVMVKTGERTVLSYFLKPFADMFERAFNED